MLETLATILLTTAAVYALIGVCFAGFFVWRGVAAIDPAAIEGTWGFRILIFPGAMAFWPLLLSRFIRRQPAPEEHNAHRDLASTAGHKCGDVA